MTRLLLLSLLVLAVCSSQTKNLIEPPCTDCIFSYQNHTMLALPVYCVPVTGIAPPSQCGTINGFENTDGTLTFTLVASTPWCFNTATLWLSASNPNTTGNARLPLEQWPFDFPTPASCQTQLTLDISISAIDAGTAACDASLWFSLAVQGWKDLVPPSPTCPPAEYNGCAKGDYAYADVHPTYDVCWFTKFLLCQQNCPPCFIVPPTFTGISPTPTNGFAINVSLYIEPNFLKDFNDINCNNGLFFKFSDFEYVTLLRIKASDLVGLQDCYSLPGTVLLSTCAYPVPSRVLAYLIPPSVNGICKDQPGEITECGFFYEPCDKSSWTFEYFRNDPPQDYLLYFFTNDSNPPALNLFCVPVGGVRVGLDNLNLNDK